MAATKAAIGLWRRLLGLLGGLLGGLLAAGRARAVDLPEDKAEALIHSYTGGGVNAYGPAFLVRKKHLRQGLAHRHRTTSTRSAMPRSTSSPPRARTTRSAHEFGLSADYVYRDSQITFGLLTSHEPDYIANTGNLDITQEVFGGMTTIASASRAAPTQVDKTQRARVPRQARRTGSTASA